MWHCHQWTWHTSDFMQPENNPSGETQSRLGGSGNAGISTVMVTPPKCDRSTCWTVLQFQFEPRLSTMFGQSVRRPCIYSTSYTVSQSHRPQTDSSLTDLNWGPGNSYAANLCRNLQRPLSSWITGPLSGYPKMSPWGRQHTCSLME
jgi:hypothetical protein